MTPYRRGPSSREEAEPEPERSSRDLFAPYAALWLVSLARVAWALASHRAFGALDTLAALALPALPALLARGRAAPR